MVRFAFLLAFSAAVCCLSPSGQRTQALNINGNLLLAAPNERPQLVLQLGHSFSVTSAVYSADNRFILTGSIDHTAILWETGTAREIRRFIGHTENIDSVALSKDARYALTGSGGEAARLWDTATGREIKQFGTTSRAVAFMPDGQAVAVGASKTARLWDVKTGQQKQQFDGHTEAITSIAVSVDGRFVITGSFDKTARVWDAVTGQQLQVFAGHSAAVYSVAFSPDARDALTGGAYNDNSVRLWDVASGKEIRRFTGSDSSISAVAFSPDGRLVAAATGTIHATIWETETGRQVKDLVISDGVNSLAFSANGHEILTCLYGGEARIWEVDTARELRRFTGLAARVNAVAISPDGRYIATGSDFTGIDYEFQNNAYIATRDTNEPLRLWDTETGEETQRLTGLTKSQVLSVAFSADSRYLASGEVSNARVWDLDAAQEKRHFTSQAPVAMVNDVMFSPDGRTLLTATGVLGQPPQDNAAHLFDFESGSELRTLKHQWPVYFASFSPDGRVVATGDYNSTARLWNAKTGKEEKSFKVRYLIGPTIPQAIFSKDGRTLFTGAQYGQLWDIATARETKAIEGIGSDISFSPDERFILSGGKLFDRQSGQLIREFKGHLGVIRRSVFSPDGQFVLTASSDGMTKIWEASSGKELCSLVTFRDDTWVVVTPDGRFDTNNLDEIKGLYWILPDNPYRPLPLEIFMRDYYEPRLLPRLLAGETLPGVRDLSTINRVQPEVTIARVEPDTATAGRVSVTLEVQNNSDKFIRDGKEVTLDSGVYDVRLFRDRQMVAYNDGEVRVDPQTGRQTIKFSGIKLPHISEPKQVEFSAYAFNSDRIKSATARMTWDVPVTSEARTPRAYVITVGVNAYENEDFDLEFAANDARRMAKAVSDRLAAVGDYREIVQVPLISDYEIRDGRKAVTEKLATKNNFQTVLQLLSNKHGQVDPKLLEEIPNAAKLMEATPDDLVLIMYSSHGYADRDGSFYFIPYDTGAGQGKVFTQTVREHSISSEELSQWLRDIDAGEMLMIVDACHSTAAIQGQEFKPGPMGSRGLGQLSYDKAMKILTATQADNVALENELLKQGLLTYALIRDGLEAGQADFRPRDQSITFSEWLQYAVARVPKLYAEIKKGKVDSAGSATTAQTKVVFGGAKELEEVLGSSSEKRTQQPSLFNFGRKHRDIALTKRQ